MRIAPALIAMLLLPASAHADAPPPGAKWTQAYITEADGTKLHADKVDLRGFGGSSGCLDWAGPGEQADVKAAVEWAASQPWSTGQACDRD